MRRLRTVSIKHNSPMNTDRDKLVKEIFADALEKANAAERAAYLTQACGNDAQLRQQVEALLQAHEKAGAFLEQPPVTALGVPPLGGPGSPPPEGGTPNGPGKTIVLSTPLTEKPGDRIGRYKLLQQIGEGGCGVVYMAEQEQPIRRRVALKVIKLGMDTKQVIARFEAERQALALMDHPNIAKVLDAGATGSDESQISNLKSEIPAGRPYFVMELVRGIKVTDYCDQNNLSTEQRLDLFVQICHAIQHAHQKGIIHRDIKPSNILVTVHDGKPLPKIIDFGIAKATTGQVLTDKTLFTAFEQFIGTPAYMSPEQAEMSTLDIDTRSDIYALGVLLYELLTGQTPFDAQELVAAGLSEMRRIIREQEPLRPSTRISTLEAADLTTVAKRRHSEPPQLVHVVRGDLDWIVMKCLEKDRTRRYETANGLADDVLRHLNDEPVTARPPGRVYRLQKLVQRNKLVFAVGAAVTAALVIGLALSTWFFFQEREARQRAVAAETRAQAEASKSQQVAQFLKDTLKGFGPSVAMGRDTTMLREILDKTAERVGKDLKDSPEVEAELRTTLGEVYQTLGQFTKAEEMHRAALVIWRGLWGNMNTNVADSLENLSDALEWQSKSADAEPLVLEALTIRTNLLGAEHLKVAECLATLGDIRWDQWRRSEAEELYRHALAMRRKLLGNDSLEVADSLAKLSNLLISQGFALDRPQEAEADAREAVAIQKRLLGAECPDPNLGFSQIVLGRALRSEGKLEEAETTVRPILAMRRKLLGSESLLVAGPSMLLAAVLQEEGKLDEAEQFGREALATYDRLKAGSTPEGAFESIGCMCNLGEVLQKKGKLAEAEAMFREAVETARKGPTLDSQANALAYLGDLFVHQGKLAEAESVLREALEIDRKLPASIWQAYVLALLGDLLRDQGKLAEAEPVYREGLDICRQDFPGNPEMVFHQWLAGNLAVTLKQQGRWAEAETFYREALTNSAKLWPHDFKKWEWQFNDLAEVLQRQDKSAEVEGLYREARAMGWNPKASDQAASALAAQGDALRDQGKFAEAEPVYREGLEICRQLATNNPETHQWLATGAAYVLQRQRRWAEAEPFYREAITNSATVWPNEPARWQWQVAYLAFVLRSQGKLAEAEPFYREAVTNAVKFWPNDFKKWEWQFNELVDVLQRQGKTNEVQQLRNEFLPAAVRNQPPETISTNKAGSANIPLNPEDL